MPQPEATGDFLKSVLSEVRWKQAHKSIERELSDHVEDQARAYRTEGMDEASAERAAIAGMGDPLALGTAFDAAYRPRPTGQVLIPIGLTLLCALLLHLFLYAPMEHYEAYANETIYKELMALLIGGVLFAAAYFMNFNWFARLSLPLYIVLLLIMYRYSGHMYGRSYANMAANRTLVLYPMLGLPVAMAGMAFWLRKLGVWGVLILAVLTLLPTAMNLESYEEGLLLSMFVSFIVLLLAILGGLFKGKKWLLLLVLVLPFALWGLFVLPKERFLWNAFRHHPLLRGELPVLAQDACDLIRGARWFGRGSTAYLSADALQYFGLDPNWDWFRSSQWGLAVNDLPLCLCYRYGRIPALLLSCLPLMVVVAGARRVLRLSGKCGRLLGAAALLTLLMQWLASLLNVFGLAVCHYPLPFLSVGYYALIADMALLGVVCSVLRSDGLR